MAKFGEDGGGLATGSFPECGFSSRACRFASGPSRVSEFAFRRDPGYLKVTFSIEGANLPRLKRGAGHWAEPRSARAVCGGVGRTGFRADAS